MKNTNNPTGGTQLQLVPFRNNRSASDGNTTIRANENSSVRAHCEHGVWGLTAQGTTLVLPWMGPQSSRNHQLGWVEAPLTASTRPGAQGQPWPQAPTAPGPPPPPILPTTSNQLFYSLSTKVFSTVPCSKL